MSGSRTATGKPMLAGDPHLPVRNPSIWYEVALDAGDLHLIGFSIPGVPGVVIGHNDRIAWSFTYAYADTQDLFVERQDPADLRRYEYEGRMENATFAREVIKVKGRADPVVVDVAVTRHGPILTPVLKEQKAQLALRWSALEGTRTVEAVMGMGRARNFTEFRAAAALFVGATLSACYADVDGHIGYQLVGRLPDRKAGDGRLPVPGWSGEYEWRGLRPADDNPFLLRSARRRRAQREQPAGGPRDRDGLGGGVGSGLPLRVPARGAHRHHRRGHREVPLAADRRDVASGAAFPRGDPLRARAESARGRSAGPRA